MCCTFIQDSRVCINIPIMMKTKIRALDDQGYWNMCCEMARKEPTWNRIKILFSFSEHACCQSVFLKVVMAKNNSIIMSFAESMKFIRYGDSL